MTTKHTTRKKARASNLNVDRATKGARELASDFTRFAREHADLAKKEYADFKDRRGDPLAKLHDLRDVRLPKFSVPALGLADLRASKPIATFKEYAADLNKALNEEFATVGRELGRSLEWVEGEVEGLVGKVRGSPTPAAARESVIATVELDEDDV